MTNIATADFIQMELINICTKSRLLKVQTETWIFSG